jgi:hypothetical protein
VLDLRGIESVSFLVKDRDERIALGIDFPRTDSKEQAPALREFTGEFSNDGPKILAIRFFSMRPPERTPGNVRDAIAGPWNFLDADLSGRGGLVAFPQNEVDQASGSPANLAIFIGLIERGVIEGPQYIRPPARVQRARLDSICGRGR